MKGYKNIVPTTVIPADTSPTTDKLTDNERYELMKTATEHIKIEMEEDRVKNIDNKDIKNPQDQQESEANERETNPRCETGRYICRSFKGYEGETQKATRY